MNKDDLTLYLLMFCGLLLVRKSHAKLADVLMILPLAGNPKLLAREIAEPVFPLEIITGFPM